MVLSYIDGRNLVGFWLKSVVCIFPAHKYTHARCQLRFLLVISQCIGDWPVCDDARGIRILPLGADRKCAGAKADPVVFGSKKNSREIGIERIDERDNKSTSNVRVEESSSWEGAIDGSGLPCENLHGFLQRENQEADLFIWEPSIPQGRSSLMSA